MTIYEEYGKFEGLNVLICGDIKILVLLEVISIV